MKKKERRVFAAVVDRIEDGQHVVLSVVGGGRIVLPKKHFPFAVREGQWLDFWASPNPKTEDQLRADVRCLQKKLLRQSKKAL